MKKNLLFISLALLLMLCCSAFAESLSYEQFTYELCEDGVVITGYTLPEEPSAIQIPDAIDGRPVVEISAHAFTDAKIKTISIPASVKRIAGNAFYGCSQDLRLMLHGNHPVFANIDGDLYEKATRTLVVGLGPELNVPDGIEAIGAYACYGQNFTTLTLPASVKTIGAHAFQDAYAPEFPLIEGVETIDESAFRFFRAQNDHLIFPSTLRTVGKEAFYKTYLSSLTFNEGLQSLADGAFSNAVYRVGETRSSSSNHGSSCRGANSGETYLNVTIPAGVKLGNNVFSELNTLAAKGSYSCKCSKKDRILADMNADTSRLLGSKSSGTQTTINGVVCFTLTLDENETVPANLFKVIKKVKLSGDTQRDAYAELSTTSTRILPTVRVVVDAPVNHALTVGAGAFSNCAEVTFKWPVTLKEAGANSFVNCRINGMITLDPSLTRWPFEGCRFEYWMGIPKHITVLGPNACTEALTDEYLHANLTQIAADAFADKSTFVVEPGSYGEIWAMENNRLYTYKQSSQDDLSWLNPSASGETEATTAAQNADDQYAAYLTALALERSGDYEAAAAAYIALGDYLDVARRLNSNADMKIVADNLRAYQAAQALEAEGDLMAASKAYLALGDYADSVQRAMNLVIQQAQQLDQEGNTQEAIALMTPYADHSAETQALFLKLKLRTYPIYYFNEAGTAFYKPSTSGYGVVDYQGNIIGEPQIYSSLQLKWQDGWSLAYIYPYYRHVDYAGKVMDDSYVAYGGFTDGHALVYKNNGYYVINAQGEDVAQLPNKKNRSYNWYAGEGLVAFQEKSKTGLCDLTGKVVAKAQYANNHPVVFENGLAVVSLQKGKNVNMGVINAKGKSVLKPSNKYSNIIILSDKLFAVQNAKTKGYSVVNPKGKTVLTEGTYSGIFKLTDEYIKISQSNKKDTLYGLMDMDLNVIMPPKMHAIEIGYQEEIIALKDSDGWQLYAMNDLTTPLHETKYASMMPSVQSPYVSAQTQSGRTVVLDSRTGEEIPW